jgi:hypothetical protein
VRRLTRRLARLAGTVAVAACANRGGLGPPGGPVDTLPPRVTAVTPESASVSQRAGAVTFHFSKVVNDAPARGALSQYFLISPTDGEPRVNWHRDRIEVRPRHGFRPNTAYSVSLLPGLADVRGHAMKEGATTLFSTGASFPRFGIVGSIFDWPAERPATGALVEAISRPDSTVYLAAADSLGQYTLGPFGQGRYTLLGFIDRNNNRVLDPSEPWDSTTVLITTSRPVLELLAITRDTVGPRISAAAREDSVTLRITFDRAIDPGMTLAPELFRLQRADSTEVPIARVIGAQFASDSAARMDSVARRDSTGRDTIARRDTTRVAAPPGPPPSVVPIPLPRPAAPRANAPSAIAPPAPRPSRRAPETAVLLRLAPAAILQAGTTYRVTARNIRNIMGRPGTSSRTVTIPKPPPPTPRDSTRGRDSTRTPPRRPPAQR